MQSLNNSPVKKRRFSSQLLSFQSIAFKHQDSINAPPINKFYKIQHKKAHARKSMDLQTISKCQQNLGQLKRNTQKNIDRLDSIQFKRIIQKRKQKSRFNFKTVDLRSIQNRHINSLFEPSNSDNMRASALQLQIKNQGPLNLQKESCQIMEIQKQIKYLNQRQIQQRAKNRILNKLTKLITQQIQTSQQKQHQLQRNISVEQKYKKQYEKQQNKMNNMIRLTNDIQQKINNYRKEINQIRSQRIVYSSIFKQLQKQIKLSQNVFIKILINSIQYYQSISYLHSMNLFQWYEKNLRYGQDYQRNQSPLNSYNQYKNYFNNFYRSAGVKFNGTINYNNDQQQLHDKINSNTAINYYTQSRKVIILPRYKEHYQSSRKKIKLQKQFNSYQFLINQITKLYHALGIYQNIQSFQNTQDFNRKCDHKSFTFTFHKSSQNSISDNKSVKTSNNFLQTKKKSFDDAILLKNEDKSKNQDKIQHQSRTTQNIQFGLVQKVNQQMNEIPNKNQVLYKQIEQIDLLIEQTNKKINDEKCRIKIFKNSGIDSDFKIKNSNDKQQQRFKQLIKSNISFRFQSNNQNQNQSQQLLDQIKNLFKQQNLHLSNNQLLSTLLKLQDFYIATKTAKLVQKPQQIPTPNKNLNNLDTDRSNISIRFKKVDQNIQNAQNNQVDKNDLLTRGPKTLNAILKNIQVYQSYERAFERMDFEKQYQIQKNKKKRTLNRRDGMVSLGLIKKQNQQKVKLLKRKSSNKKQNEKP